MAPPAVVVLCDEYAALAGVAVAGVPSSSPTPQPSRCGCCDRAVGAHSGAGPRGPHGDRGRPPDRPPRPSPAERGAGDPAGRRGRPRRGAGARLRRPGRLPGGRGELAEVLAVLLTLSLATPPRTPRPATFACASRHPRPLPAAGASRRPSRRTAGRNRPSGLAIAVASVRRVTVPTTGEPPSSSTPAPSWGSARSGPGTKRPCTGSTSAARRCTGSTPPPAPTRASPLPAAVPVVRPRAGRRGPLLALVDGSTPSTSGPARRRSSPVPMTQPRHEVRRRQGLP